MDSKLILSKRRDTFFKNLLLLGLETSLMKKKHGIDFNKDMFSVPNKKGFEIITYFLFMKLDKISDEDYSIVWPLLDKDQERQFKKTAFNHVLNISQKSTVRFPRIVKSIFSSPGGDRFYTLYLAFSSYVLEQQIKKNGNVHLIQRSFMNQNNHKDISETLKLSTIIATKNFQDTQTVSLEHQQKWIACAKDFYSHYRNIKKCLTSKDMLLRERKILLSSLYSEYEGMSMNDNLEAIDVNIAERCEKVKELWESMGNYQIKEKELWEIFRCALDNDGANYSLEGPKFMSSVPDILSKDYSNELEQDIFQKQEIVSQLCVLSFIKLVTLCVNFYEKCSKRAGVALSQLLLPNEKDISSGEETLQFMKSLSKKLIDEVIPNMENQNCVLKQELLSNKFLEPSPTIYSSFPPLSPKTNFDAESVRSRCVLPSTGNLLLLPSSETSLDMKLESMAEMDNTSQMSRSDSKDIELLDSLGNEADLNQSKSEDSEIWEADPEESFKMEQSESENPNELLEINPEESFIVQPNFCDNITPISYLCHNPNEYARKLSTINESSEETSAQCVPMHKEFPSLLDDSMFDDGFYSTPSKLSRKRFNKNNRRTKFNMRESWLKEDNLTSLTANDLVDFSPS